MQTDQYITEEFFTCPECGEESVAMIRPGFNKLDCPFCGFYLIVYQDGEQRNWTRVPGVLSGCES